MRLAPRAVVGAADVDREAAPAGMTLTAPGGRLDLADRGDQIRPSPAPRARPPAPSRPRRRARRGVGPSARCRHARPCPSTSTREAAGAVDRGHDADRQALRLEHRALLDVDLDIAEHVLAGAGRARGMAAGSQPKPRSASRMRRRPRRRRRGLRIEGAGDRARAGQRGREAHAFLVAEGDHLDRERQALAGACSAATASMPASTPSLPS